MGRDDQSSYSSPYSCIARYRIARPYLNGSVAPLAISRAAMTCPDATMREPTRLCSYCNVTHVRPSESVIASPSARTARARRCALERCVASYQRSYSVCPPARRVSYESIQSRQAHRATERHCGHTLAVYCVHFAAYRRVICKARNRLSVPLVAPRHPREYLLV